MTACYQNTIYLLSIYYYHLSSWNSLSNCYNFYYFLSFRNSFQTDGIYQFSKQLSDANYNLNSNTDFLSTENFYQIRNSFQISCLKMATIYRPRFCYQKANCNQPPKSELLLNANRYQQRHFIKRELVSFCFFIVFGNELRYEKMPNFVRLLIARRQRRSECESPEFAGVRQFFMTAC